MSSRECPCGRGFPVLESVSGRAIESLIKPTGELVSPIYLITLLGTRIDSSLVERFQVVQDELTRVTLKIVVNQEAVEQTARQHAQSVGRQLGEIMGCDVRCEFVDEIPREKSGKYLYIVCNVPRDTATAVGLNTFNGGA